MARRAFNLPTALASVALACHDEKCEAVIDARIRMSATTKVISSRLKPCSAVLFGRRI
jgi:hypothetical protein